MDEEIMTIRQIKKEFGVGNEKAHFIKKQLYGDINISPGRPPSIIYQNEYDYVNQYKQNFNVGYQRLYNVTRQKCQCPKTLTEWKVRTIFDYDDLYVTGSEFKVPVVHDERYIAKYAGQAWHTDLHYSKKYADENFHQYYLIAFIDDRTRKILHYEVLPDKSMKSTSSALENALMKYSPPKSMIIDNGKEFTGADFQKVLKNYGVKSHTITPYTPQENGKIERFWRTLEQSKPKEKRFRGKYLDDIINEYNTSWYHYGLKEITNQMMTPEYAWKTMEHYDGQPDACFIKY